MEILYVTEIHKPDQIDQIISLSVAIWVYNNNQAGKHNIKTLTIKSGGVVLDTSQVQVVIPSLRVLIHTVMLTLAGRRLIALPFAAKNAPNPHD